MAGSRTQTQTQVNEPYAAAKPGLDWAMGEGLRMAQAGQLGQPFTGSTVVPFSGQSIQALNGMQNYAQQQAGNMGQGLQAMQGLIGSGGQNSMTQGAWNNLTPFASGQNAVNPAWLQSLGKQSTLNPYAGNFQELSQSATANPAMQGFASMTGQGGPSMSEQNLSKVASGDLLSGGDPYFQQVMEQAQRAAGDAVNLQASSMGRTGSGANQGVLAREIGDLTARMGSDQYNRERQAQVQANQLIDAQRSQADQTRLAALSGQGGLYNAGQQQALNAANSGTQAYLAGLGQAMNAAGNVANIEGGNMDRQMSAILQQGNLGQNSINNLLAATAMMPNAFQAGNLPYELMRQVGGEYEDLYGRTLNDRLRIGQETQQGPLRNIQQLLGILSGSGQYGSNTQTAQMPNNTFSNILGAALGLGGLFR